MFKIILPKLNFKIEKWKYNKEFRIYVSTLGHFKDEHKKNMAVYVSKNGYCMVKTKYGLKQVHRLVMLTWRPIPNAEDFTVDHLNHNKRCNELSNLEWVTFEENQRRAERDQVSIVATKEFKNIHEAIDYAIKSQNMYNTKTEYKPKRQTIKKRILYAIKTNKPYCNIMWKVKED